MAVVKVGDHIHLLDGARKIWGTDDPPIQLIPEAWQDIPITIQFPDFPKDIAYAFNVYYSGPPLNSTTHYAMSFVKIQPQDLTLPNQILGTVPEGINYVDWRVTLNWTKMPSQVNGLNVSSPIVRGKQTDLRGGSAVMELSRAFSRMMHIEVQGQNVVLIRRQTARNRDDVSGGGNLDWSPGNATHFPNGGVRPGWTHGGTTQGTISMYLGQVAQGAGATRGSGNGAPMGDISDYSSTWTGTLHVKPGRYNILT